MGGFVKFLEPLKAALTKFVNGLILAKAGKSAEDVARISEEFGGIVLQHVLAASQSDLDSAEKHKQVAAQVVAIIREPGGLDAPEWLLAILQDGLDDLISALVKLAHDKGLFRS